MARAAVTTQASAGLWMKALKGWPMGPTARLLFFAPGGGVVGAGPTHPPTQRRETPPLGPPPPDPSVGVPGSTKTGVKKHLTLARRGSWVWVMGGGWWWWWSGAIPMSGFVFGFHGYCRRSVWDRSVVRIMVVVGFVVAVVV